MPELGPPDAPYTSWLQPEQSIERLHAAARAGMTPREFYGQVLEELVDSLGATTAAVWLIDRVHGPQLFCQRPAQQADAQDEPLAARRAAVQRSLASAEPTIQGDCLHGEASPNENYETLLYPIEAAPLGSEENTRLKMLAVLEIGFTTGESPLVVQGWIEFARAVAAVASDFQALHELKLLREAAAVHGAAATLGRRLQSTLDLEATALEIASEGRRLLDCDRLTVVIRRRGRWRVVGVSGAVRIERHIEFTRRLEQLAQQVAHWGEPIAYPPCAAVFDAHDPAELPAQVSGAIDEHLDHAHAKEIACVPVRFKLCDDAESGVTPKASPAGHADFDAVLIAERFHAANPRHSPQRLVELAEQCAPALSRAAALDRFPLRTMLRWSEQLERLRTPGRRARALAIAGAIAAVVLVLALAPADFDVEASGTLRAAVERDVFATATGAVAEVHVEHGQMVGPGDVLVVLSDPELSLNLQKTRGEIDATRKRLDALAITRTDRVLRDQEADDRLPLAAEQRQLEERLSSLLAEVDLLERRRDSLTLRSPLAGQVLTPDVHGLLDSRPVERGQVLLTVADTASGWHLEADLPQRQVGHVLSAQHSRQHDDEQLAATLRLAGDVTQTYSGRVLSIDAAAPLEAEGLEDEPSPVKVRIAVTGQPPAAARPGMTATARIHCGQRKLGYVWLHDVGATVYRWLTF